MRMVRDQYTGEMYDADVWTRDKNACWVKKSDLEKHRQKLAEVANRRQEIRNRNRVARGKRRKSPREFARSSSRYDEWLSEDNGIPFGEWLKSRYGKRWY